jgi:protein phosphatase inhibitor 2
MQSPLDTTELSDVPSRRSSTASLGRSSSGRSSRSTSFNLPKDATKDIRLGYGPAGEEVEVEHDLDPESMFSIFC